MRVNRELALLRQLCETAKTKANTVQFFSRRALEGPTASSVTAFRLDSFAGAMVFGEFKISNSWKMSHVRSAAWERVPVRRLSPITFDYSTLELTVPSTSRPIYIWALEALQPSSPFNCAEPELAPHPARPSTSTAAAR